MKHSDTDGADADAATLAATLRSRYLTEGPENLDERLAQASEIVRIAERNGDLETALKARVWRVTDLLELGEIAAADAEIDMHARLAEELRHPESLWRSAVFRAMRSLMQGRLEEAEWLAQEALAMGRQTQAPDVLNVFGAQMFTLRREQGRLQEMETVLKSFVTQSPRIFGWECALALLCSELGRAAAARACFDRILADNDIPHLRRDVFWLAAMATLAEVCAAIADQRRAAMFYDLLCPYADHCVVVGYGSVVYGSVSHQLGRLAAVMSRQGDAERHFEAALAVHARIGARPILARTRHAYAEVILVDGSGDRSSAAAAPRERALDLLDQALATYQELGMSGHRERALLLKRRAGDADPATAEPAAGDAAAEAGPFAGRDDSLAPAGHPAAGDSAPRVGADAVDVEDSRASFRTFLIVRLSVSLALCTLIPLGLFLADWPSVFRPILGIIAAGTALGLAYYAIARARPGWVTARLYTIVHLLDLLLATTALVYVSREDALIVVQVYALIIMRYAAITLSATGTLFLAAVAAAGYVVVGGSVWADPNGAPVSVFLRSETARLVANTVFLAVLAFMTMTLARAARRQRDRSRTLQARLRALNESLERKVSARTRALDSANASLVVANLKLEGLNREIELYTRAVSHDVRNPIAAAGEALRLLRSGAGNAGERLAELAGDGIERAERMLVGLRDMMRASVPESTQSVPVRQLVGKMAEEVREAGAAQAPRIEFVGEWLPVEAQPTKLAHVFRNLLDNAVTHTRRRPDARIEIGQAAHGGDALFWVRDNGKGIPLGYHSAVFEPFHRGAGGKGEGMGLGLALVRQIVRQHGGKIWVESIPGAGATFWFTLPQKRKRLEA